MPDLVEPTSDSMLMLSAFASIEGFFDEEEEGLVLLKTCSKPKAWPLLDLLETLVVALLFASNDIGRIILRLPPVLISLSFRDRKTQGLI